MPLTKTIFRQNCLQKLRNIPTHNKLYRNSLLNKRLLKELKGIQNASILFYIPMNIEVDIFKVLINIRRKNDIFIPFMVGESFKMVPFRLPLERKKFGIYEAGNTYRNINKIDIAIVPVVGVDGNLQRVGFGKGMYDRFFEKLQKRPYTIFIQQEFCYTKESVCDSYDVTGDILLTPTRKMVRVKKRK